ncbi:LolA family protein [Adhaeribacter rhizoryzae]|uniref:Outer membrane lipoprotein carrier protein LolA n=1 Tax=Adhaeribacter rhizoryzae TaxID=2607907 RepID=A0A5M6DPR2_9BACT|nr:outer membrane lipoprotein carrier protein LolA [Adhaeribacter rhizoryzae]KAA5548199.1 outer membrane lipoprotein carrier protein LolA [Adhaeribacter rhizoryzae]
MKKTIPFLLALFLTISFAQAQQDPRAEKILNAMSQKYQTLKAFNVAFTQTLENSSSKIKETMQGDITVSGNKFRLKLKDQEIINNGNTIWTYMKSDNEVNISENDPDDQQMSPNAIFTLYQKGYNYTFVEEMREGGQAYNIIELSPLDKNNSVYKVRLQINKRDNSVKTWKMFRNNGNRYTYTIKSFNPSPVVDANYFAFDKSQYKGVKVIDLR